MSTLVQKTVNKLKHGVLRRQALAVALGNAINCPVLQNLCQLLHMKLNRLTACDPQEDHVSQLVTQTCPGGRSRAPDPAVLGREEAGPPQRAATRGPLPYCTVHDGVIFHRFDKSIISFLFELCTRLKLIVQF